MIPLLKRIAERRNTPQDKTQVRLPTGSKFSSGNRQGAVPVPSGFKLSWDDFQAAVLDSFDAVLRHALAVHPPLGLQHRLNDVLAAAAEGHAHLVVLGAPQQPLALQPFHHRLPHLQVAVCTCLTVKTLGFQGQSFFTCRLQSAPFQSGKRLGSRDIALLKT